MSRAGVIDLDTYRDRHLVANVVRREPWPDGWETLAWVNVDDKRDALRQYVRRGLHPILVNGVVDGQCTCGRGDCSAVGKHPAHAGWQRQALNVERLDREIMERWQLNLGLRMGPQPDGTSLVCIDVDGDRELLAPIEAEHGSLPPTLTQRTARGWHFIFRVPPSRVIKNRVRLAPGVDVRAAGGMIVVAPSVHRSGARYRWVDAREPEVLR